MVNYNLNVFTKRNPWLPIIFFILGYPYIIIMGIIIGAIASTSPALAIILGILTFVGALLLFIYPLDRIYKINLELLNIDSDAPEKNSWIVAILLSFILIGIPYFWYLLFKFSKSLEKISSKEIPIIVTFLLLFFIFPLGVTYSQYKINKLQRNNNSNESSLS